MTALTKDSGSGQNCGLQHRRSLISNHYFWLCELNWTALVPVSPPLEWAPLHFANSSFLASFLDFKLASELLQLVGKFVLLLFGLPPLGEFPLQVDLRGCELFFPSTNDFAPELVSSVPPLLCRVSPLTVQAPQIVLLHLHFTKLSQQLEEEQLYSCYGWLG